MILKSNTLTEIQAREISTWKYEGEYSIYNLPDWDTMVKEKYSLCDDTKRSRFTTYTNEENDIVGFTNLLDEGNHVFFGIGVNPIYCNNGFGKIITKLSIEKCKEKYPNKKIVLEVRTWNKRAVNCYKSQGFNIVGIKEQETCLGKGEFYIMEY